MSIRWLLIVFMLGCGGCTHRKNEIRCVAERTNSVYLEKTGHVSIPVPDSLNYELRHQKVICERQAECFLVGLDPTRNSIDIYDLNAQKFIRSVQFFDDGRPGSFSISAYCVHRPDSLFLFSEESFQLLLISHKNAISKIWDLKPAMIELNLKYQGLYLDLLDNDMVFDKRKGFIYFKLANELYRPGSAKSFTFPLIAAYDLRKEQFVGVYGNFPAEFREKPNPLSIAFRIEGTGPGNGVLINFYSSHYLIEFFENGLAQEICRKSNYLPSVYPNYTDSFDDFASFQRYVVQNGYYVKCLFDYENNPRVMVIKHAVTDRPETRPANGYDAPFSLMIFEGKFLGEIPFPSRKYNYFNTQLLDGKFVLMDCNNPYNSEMREGFIEFDVFEIKKSDDS